MPNWTLRDPCILEDNSNFNEINSFIVVELLHTKLNKHI